MIRAIRFVQISPSHRPRVARCLGPSKGCISSHKAAGLNLRPSCPTLDRRRWLAFKWSTHQPFNGLQEPSSLYIPSVLQIHHPPAVHNFLDLLRVLESPLDLTSKIRGVARIEKQ